MRLRWVFTDQPFLAPGTNSVVNNRIWNGDDAEEYPVGQLPKELSNYVQDARWTLPALAFTGHQCNPQWFATGEPWPIPPDLPPTVYLAGWIPECCVMSCVQTDCKTEPVNGAPASQIYQYSTPVNDATDATPVIKQVVADALVVSGGNWPGEQFTWQPAGRTGAPAYTLTSLAQPGGAPYSRVEQFTFDATTLTDTLNAAGRGWAITDGVTTGALTLSIFGGMLQIGGSNARITSDLLPVGFESRTTKGVIAAGTTQADAAPTLSTGTECVALSSAAGIRMAVSGAASIDASTQRNGIYTVVHVNSSPAATLKLYPAVGDAFPFVGLNNPLTLARDTGVILIQNAGPQGSWAVIPYPLAPGTVTSVNLTPPAAGITVSGGPIVSAGSITLALADDLAALEALGGTNTIYYRSAVSTWSPVTVGSGLTFAAGTLASDVGTTYVLVQDRKGATTEGGSSAAAAYQTRVLNTIVSDTGGHCSLSANQITLSAGTWIVRGRCPAYRVGRHQARLRNVTGGVDLVLGTPAYSESANNVEGWSFLEGRFTVTAGQALEVQHYTTLATATQGLGLYGDGTSPSIYTSVEFTKVG